MCCFWNAQYFSNYVYITWQQIPINFYRFPLSTTRKLLVPYIDKHLNVMLRERLSSLVSENLRQMAIEMKQTVNNKVWYFRHTNETLKQTQFTMGRFWFYLNIDWVLRGLVIVVVFTTPHLYKIIFLLSLSSSPRYMCFLRARELNNCCCVRMTFFGGGRRKCWCATSLRKERKKRKKSSEKIFFISFIHLNILILIFYEPSFRVLQHTHWLNRIFHLSYSLPFLSLFGDKHFFHSSLHKTAWKTFKLS